MDYQKLGFVAIRRGDYQESINIFKRALEREKSAKSFTGLGSAFHHVGDHLTARWAFNKALELEPKNEEALRYISGVENYKRQSSPPRQSLFRVGDNYIELYDGKWRTLFIKGINLGLGLPGYFPGHYPIKKGTYLKWFKQIEQLGINAIRIYTVHPPSFYEALYEFNGSGKTLCLLQGIWAALPKNNIFSDERYMAELKRDIKNAVDVVHGNANLPERPGYTHGSYQHDVSPFTIAFIFGREWESCAVKEFNEHMGRRLMNYDGSFLAIRDGTPFETWVAEICDFLQAYEYEKYDKSLILSLTNWPTLDPLDHPSESENEKELLLQGVRIKKEGCYGIPDEDIESLDSSKFIVKQGGGLFATYHAYPYYPDFVSNDYLQEKNMYLAYLKALKRHHKGQPILIAEFGVPSSREVSHGHRDGWHHGGHNEAEQGEINGFLMKTIYQAGMAGGAVFSWFDEWFKRNWLFLPYEIPAERNRFWFNSQDPEQNYGLLATCPGYPGRKVRLAGRLEDWKDASVLYEKKNDSMAFRFHDGSDDARAFYRILIQHDEGFLFLLIETKGKIDFRQANYMIGLDTCCSESGEFLFPFGTNLQSPVGLKFLIHITGREKSRILACQQYDKYLNRKKGEIKPGLSDQGAWVVMNNKTNHRRISKDASRFFPSRVFSMSALRFGSLDRKNPYYDSLSDFFVTDNIIELRIPWGLINFTDPSSKTVLWQDKEGMVKKTNGVKIVAVSYKPEKGRLLAERTGMQYNVTDHLPQRLVMPKDVKAYSWQGWDTPVYHSYLKESYFKYKEVLSEIAEGT